MPEMNDDFYVGYQPQPSPRIRRLMRRTIPSLVLFGLAIAIILALAQAPFADSSFDYGVYKRYQGRVLQHPYPKLFANGLFYPLAGPGKHGLFNAKDGQIVELEASLIVNGDMRALEVRPESWKEIGGSFPSAPVPTPLGMVKMIGEIVDTKCHLGVMNPGSGKVHRSCAARCLSGGVPPGLLVRDATGKTRTVLLEGVEGRQILELVAEPVSATGQLRREGTILVLTVAALKRE
ncbi:MAG: hypothetical protein K2X03_04115 [Bryobacteraceae bacterium]|nr:hypothetical protein [Bryobacteraceae bacterium]